MSMVNYIVDGELYHHGIKGQRWGDRNYQYEDGSLTPEGRRRYYGSAGLNRFRFGDAKSKPKTKEEKEMAKANSAYRVERHKAKMERKTQEALNKEKIKKEQSNAKRNAIISKLKGNKQSTQVKKVDGESEEKRNDKKFEKNVKELLTAKKIKDYSKYTKEELEEAANRKEAENRIDAERRKSTKFGRAQEFFNSPAGQTLLNTATKEAISGLSDIAKDWGKEAISKYLDKNAKEMYERSIDREGWEAKRASVIEKLSAESSQAGAKAAKEWRQAEGEGLKNDSQRLSNESQHLSNQSQSMKNKQLRIENERNNAEYEAQKGVREAKNKADLDSAKASIEEAKAKRAEAKARQSEAKVKQEETKTKLEIEKSYQSRIKQDRTNFNELGGMYLNNLKVRLNQNTQAIISNSNNVKLNQINVNSLSEDELATLMKFLNSRN